jgi:hypothetical protein
MAEYRSVSKELMTAINKQCECVYDADKLVSVCASHKAVAEDDNRSFEHHLEFIRTIRRQFLKAEFSEPNQAA